MRIKINLSYILEKNRTTLSSFLERNEISSYEELAAHCARTNMIPVSEEEYRAVVGSGDDDKKEKAPNETTTKSRTPKSTAKPSSKESKSGPAGKTQVKKRSRTRAKKV